MKLSIGVKMYSGDSKMYCFVSVKTDETLYRCMESAVVYR